jgi:hypothetical protein
MEYRRNKMKTAVSFYHREYFWTILKVLLFLVCFTLFILLMRDVWDKFRCGDIPNLLDKKIELISKG